MNLVLIKGIILFVVLLFVLVPFFKKEGERFGEDYEESRVHDLLSQKDIVLATLLDLEYDYKMGKLSKKDYSSLKVQMKNEAADIFEQIDKIEKRADNNA